jgi:hypothetical protein
MMYSIRLVLILVVGPTILAPAAVRAIEVKGDVKGTWTVEDSPHNVVGNLRVARGDSLNIEPGVVVNFQGYYRLLVDTMAVLKAIGSESDSIIFTAQDTAQGWRGIRFIYAGQLSRLSHCRIEYGRATGYDREEFDGGGILCWSSNPSIVNCTIRRNRAEWWGGGICCEEHSNPLIAGNTIYENSATYGAGIACSYYAAAFITRNQIYDNTAKTLGGGIYSRYSEPRIEDNLLYGNVGKFRGGGIYCRGSKPKITNITVIQNEAGRVGGGICCVLSQPTIRNAIFWGNSCSKSPEIHLDRSTLTIRYSNIKGGWEGTGNIAEDPLFADPKKGDFSLGEGSPCIDTGDPESLPDRDGSVSDMGARFPNWLEDKR